MFKDKRGTEWQCRVTMQTLQDAEVFAGFDFLRDSADPNFGGIFDNLGKTLGFLYCTAVPKDGKAKGYTYEEFCERFSYDLVLEAANDLIKSIKDWFPPQEPEGAEKKARPTDGKTSGG